MTRIAGRMRRAVFLDRDGVILRAIVRDGRPIAPASLEEAAYDPDAPAAIQRLRAAGFLTIVVTNQPDVGSGLLRAEAVEAIHADLRARLPVDDIKVCYHTSDDACACRKPKPGMLLDAARAWGVDLARSVMIGDRWSDIAAGRAAGCKTVLIDAAYAERAAEAPDATVRSLAEASQVILSTWNHRPRTEVLHAGP